MATLLCNTKGERELLQAPGPLVAEALPGSLRTQECLRFDPSVYDLRGEAAALLEHAGPEVGFGRFEGPSRELEDFSASESVFSSFKYEKRWRQCVLEAEGFLRAYERLVHEVVCPALKAKLGPEAPETTFFYQYPPTLRLQPGPSQQFRRAHRDAEYGHQTGEVNFWMPLTDPAKTEVTLWTESEPEAGDYQPFELDYGCIGMFHGTLCRHYVPANETPFTRISVDFRIGVGACFDAAWSLKGISHVHGRRTCVL